MEKKGYISSFWQDSELGGRRHYYSLTASGKAELEKAGTTVSQADIQSILEDEKKTTEKETLLIEKSPTPVIKNRISYEKFDPTLEGVHSQSFSQQMKKHSEIIELTEKNTATKRQSEDVFFEKSTPKQPQEPIDSQSFWRESIRDEESKDDIVSNEFKLNDTPKSSRFDINYKDILGDLDADKPAQIQQNTTPPPPPPQQKEQQRGNIYSQEVSNIFAQKNQTTPLEHMQREKEFKEAIFKQQNQGTIDEINRRYNLNGEGEKQNFNSPESQPVHNRVRPLEAEITEYSPDKSMVVSSEKEFLCINKLALARSIIMTFFYAMAVLISYFVFKDQLLIYSPHTWLYWLALGLGAVYLGIMLIVTLTHLNKKIQLKKVNWLMNLFYRGLFAIVLFTLTIALCLCFGMNSLSQIEFFTLWYLPTLAIGSILISWVVGIILYSTKKFRQ